MEINPIEILETSEKKEWKKTRSNFDFTKSERVIEYMQVLVIENGILKSIEKRQDDVKRELSKENFSYRLETSDWKILLIDYDKDKARPYVKALLAKVGKLREVKMLWWAILLLVINIFFTAFSYFSISIQSGGIEKKIEEMKPENAQQGIFWVKLQAPSEPKINSWSTK